MSIDDDQVLQGLELDRRHREVLAFVKAINGAIAATGDLGVCLGHQGALAVQWGLLEAALLALGEAVKLATGHPDLELGWKDTLEGLAGDLDTFVRVLPPLGGPQAPRPAADRGPRRH